MMPAERPAPTSPPRSASTGFRETPTPLTYSGPGVPGGTTSAAWSRLTLLCWATSCQVPSQQTTSCRTSGGCPEHGECGDRACDRRAVAEHRDGPLLLDLKPVVERVPEAVCAVHQHQHEEAEEDHEGQRVPDDGAQLPVVR